MQKDNYEVKDLVVEKKGHLDVPSQCPPELAPYINQCWSYESEKRPRFSTLQTVFEDFINKKVPDDQPYDNLPMKRATVVMYSGARNPETRGGRPRHCDPRPDPEK